MPVSQRRVLTDLPFGKQFGTVQGNERLYPRVLAELARVVRCGGRAVLLTSAANDVTMQATLASAMPKNTWIELCSRQTSTSTKTEDSQHEPRLHARAGAWTVEHRFGFMLFCSMRARVYVLRRTAAAAPSPDEAEAWCLANLDVLRAWARRSQLARPRTCPGVKSKAPRDGTEDNGICGGVSTSSRTMSTCGASSLDRAPDVYVERLGGSCSKLPWDDGSGWRNQWMRARPPMVVCGG